MENLVVVGCGDHYRFNVAPSLAAMQDAKETKLIATVDVKALDRDFVSLSVPHVVR